MIRCIIGFKVSAIPSLRIKDSSLDLKRLLGLQAKKLTSSERFSIEFDDATPVRDSWTDEQLDGRN